MSTPFRDGSAALERIAALEQQNETLRAELDLVTNTRDELATLRAEVVALRAVARGENEGAYLRRLGEERDELRGEVRELRARVADQERELGRLRSRLRMTDSGLLGVIGSLLGKE